MEQICLFDRDIETQVIVDLEELEGKERINAIIDVSSSKSDLTLIEHLVINITMPRIDRFN